MKAVLDPHLMQKNLWTNLSQAVHRFEARLTAFIRARVPDREDAEDVLQDVWVQMAKLNEVNEIESLSGWLFTVARNKITDLFRKKNPESLEALMGGDNGSADLVDESLLSDERYSPDAMLFKKLVWVELFAALDELPEKQRQAFVENEIEGKTLQEIADESGEKLKTIISRKQYAVQHLRHSLRHLYDEQNNHF